MRYVVGVDGGGTKTKAAVYGEEIGMVGDAETGPANYRSVGMESASANIAQAISNAARVAGIEVSALAGICMCLAGFDTDLDLPVPQSAMRQLSFHGPAIMENDVVGAWAGATEAKPGLVVIAGTGATGLGMNTRGDLWRTDGWDYLLGDDGSGYDIGRAGIRTAMHMLDGRERPTALVHILSQVFGVSDGESMRRLWDSTPFGKFEVAGFARHVADAAVQGDPAAQQILRNAGQALGKSGAAIIRMLEMTGESFVVSTVGSVFKNEPWVTEPFRHEISGTAPNATFRAPAHPPEAGAAILTLRRLDEDDLSSWTLGGGKRHIRRSLHVDDIPQA
jgi:N-acetylglucosamine kinase-like BadF-type ATPase